MLQNIITLKYEEIFFTSHVILALIHKTLEFELYIYINILYIVGIDL